MEKELKNYLIKLSGFSEKDFEQSHKRSAIKNIFNSASFFCTVLLCIFNHYVFNIIEGEPFLSLKF
jgi:hypothetical protein